MKRVSEVKDLGIILDPKLCFDKHINYIFRRCNKLLGFIFRACTNFRSNKSYMFLYNSLVRSLCEYGAVIWNPHYKIYTNKIERIQRKFTRILYYKIKKPKQEYEIRLSFFKMQKLSLRRECIDEITCLKLSMDILYPTFWIRSTLTLHTIQHEINLHSSCQREVQMCDLNVHHTGYSINTIINSTI